MSIGGHRPRGSKRFRYCITLIVSLVLALESATRSSERSPQNRPLRAISVDCGALWSSATKPQILVEVASESLQQSEVVYESFRFVGVLSER